MGWIMVSGPGIFNDTIGQYQAVSYGQQYS